ncbi:C25 family cysteine peptidase, partial [Bacteroidales bacterium OttesenSCG-928-I21]|nr:C25 family cysteine peptidase [Bacteroidales bacterium OttesenSCG-928-I21]
MNLLFIGISILGMSQVNIKLDGVQKNSEITTNEINRFIFTNSINEIKLSEVKTKDGVYTKVEVPEYITNNDIGNPDLPVLSKLIEAPLFYKDVVININVKKTHSININDYGIEKLVVPAQPSLKKNQDKASVPFEKNPKIYTDGEYYESRLVKIENIGKLRGVQIAQLLISPFSYDVESNTLDIISEVEVEIVFKGGDIAETQKMKQDKYSPAFDKIYKKLWNYRQSNTKDELSQYPIKYVIISNRMFEETLQPFIEWKTKKGFNVVTAYTDEIGTTTANIKSYMQNLYDAGTTNDPAPSYLLIVGDVAQVATTQITGSDQHPSDMYYCEFDGGSDYIPEMFFGRFSATTVEQLEPQIEKTLMYEQYTFPDPTFLENAVLVGGNDSYWATTHANGQMNYFNSLYLNTEHGVNTTKYLHPASNSQRNAIISSINTGASIVNYTAHCGEDGWAGPNFVVSDVPNLTNNDKYFFSIGNCCLSNK